MASSVSTRLSLELMTKGEQPNAWGDKTNTNLKMLEGAISGYVSITNSASTYTLSVTDYTLGTYHNFVFKFSGSPSGTVTVTVPDKERLYVFYNAYATASLKIKGTSSVTVTIPAGKTAAVYHNGADILTMADYIFDVETETLKVNDYASIGTAPVNSRALNVIPVLNTDPTSTGSGTGTQYGIYNSTNFDKYVTTGYGIRSASDGSAGTAPYTTTAIYNFYSDDFTKGTDQTLTNQYGYYSSTLTSATNNYNFFSSSNLPNATAITNINGSAGTVTVTSASHGLIAGDKCIISLTPTTTMTSGLYNGGPFTVVSASTNTFTFTSSATSSAAVTSGSVTKTNNYGYYSSGDGLSYLNGPMIISTNKEVTALRITQSGTGDAFVVEDSTNPDSTSFQIKADGKLYTSNAVTFGDTSEHTTGELNIVNATNPTIAFARDDTSVVDGDNLGSIVFYGKDTTSNAYTAHASIIAEASGTHSAGDNPSQITFYTTQDGTSTQNQNLVIAQDGFLYSSPQGNSNGLVQGHKYFRLNSTLTLANSTSTQEIFGKSCSVIGGLSYEIEMLMILYKTAGTTNHTVSIAFGGGYVPNTVRLLIQSRSYDGSYTTITSPDNMFIINTDSLTAINSASNNATQSHIVLVKGIVDVSTTGTFTPQVDFSAAPGGAYSVIAGSYIKVSPLGPQNADLNIGSWS